jgi:hypothetical protein
MKLDLLSILKMVEEEDKKLEENKLPVPQKKQESALDLQGLFSLFEELEPSLNEMAKEREKIDISWDGIPEVPMSEIAFGGKGQDIISQEKKERLKVFLENIEGSSFEEKLQNLSRFLNGELIDENTSIEKSLSYLVLLKVFTSNLTDFNEKSAGTNFEAIFASLMGGEQVSGGGADFSDTADAMVNGERYSLKLTTSNIIGNKKHILIRTLADDSNRKREVNYIIAHKKAMQGGVNVDFYKYIISMDNVFDLLNGDKPSGTDKMFLNPKDQQAPTNTSAKEDPVLNNIAKVAESNEYILNFIKSARLDKTKNNIDILKNIVGPDRTEQRKKAQLALKFFEYNTLQRITLQGNFATDQKFFEKYNQAKEKLTPEGQQELAQAENQAEVFLQQYKEVSEKLTEALQEKQEKEYITREQFNQLDVSQKLQYLFRSVHIDSSNNFKIPIASSKKIATIQFGPKSIEEVYSKYKERLDTSVFQIFKELKIMSLNLESFFAGGMKDLDQAARAQKASKIINQMTEKFTKQSVEPKQ